MPIRSLFILGALTACLTHMGVARETGPSNPTTSAVSPVAPARADDPCLASEVAATPTRPNWSNSASTTQCGVVEFDSGWLAQSFRDRSALHTQTSSVRYGIGPRLDFRWAIPGPVNQKAVGQSAVNGVSDQWFSLRYRFLEQGVWSPALAFTYGVKSPTASPSKGLGTGRIDQLLLLIASRDLGKLHLDFNTAGTMAGAARGRDGGAQVGLVLSAPMTKKLTAMLETDGGSTPGTKTRYGEALLGASWTVNPRFVLDSAYTRGYTAGAPRQQITVGCTYALRSKIVLGTPRRAAWAKMLGH
jgi:hypothetical protein